MKESEALEIIGMIATAYPSNKLDQAGAKLYRQLILDLPADETRKAVIRLISTSKFLPTIAEIREAATDLKLGPMRTGGEAWGEAMLAVRKYDRSESPKWSEPIMAEAMRLWGSWVDFCNSPADDPGGRARFIELYEQLSKRQRVDVVSGIALPAPSAPLRLVESGKEESDGQGSRRRARLADGVGRDDARVPAGIARGRAEGADQANRQLPVSPPATGQGDVRGHVAGPTQLKPREWKRYTPEEIEAEMGAL